MIVNFENQSFEENDNDESRLLPIRWFEPDSFVMPLVRRRIDSRSLLLNGKEVHWVNPLLGNAGKIVSWIGAMNFTTDI